MEKLMISTILPTAASDKLANFSTRAPSESDYLD